MSKKIYQIQPDSILRLNSTKKSKNPKFVETALTEIGECCGVDLCTGIVRHYDPIDGEVVEYSVVDGVFAVRAPVSAGIPKKKFNISTGAIYKQNREARPLGQEPMHYVEDILNEQSNCCGSDCCGSNMIRLPNYTENVIYEFGVQGGVTQTPAAVTGITPGTVNKVKRAYRIVPEAINVKTSRHRMGQMNGYASINYFEQIQENMVSCGYWGFDCCEGRLILPDQNDLTALYEVRIVAAAFVTSLLDAGSSPLATAVVKTAPGSDTVPGVVTLGGFFEAGEILTVTQTHSIDGAEVGTYTVPAGGQSAVQVAVSAAVKFTADYSSVDVTDNGVELEFLTDTNPDTLNIDSAVVTQV